MMFDLKIFKRKKSNIDYKRELEIAAKNMILIHDPLLLNKMVVRMIVHKLKVRHATILLHNKNDNTYTVSTSRGQGNLKDNSGYLRINTDNPLICFFKKQRNKKLSDDGLLVYERLNSTIKDSKDFSSGNYLIDVSRQMEKFDAAVCIPGYFEQELLGVLILGNKKDGGEYTQSELNFFSALASNVTMAIRNAQLFKEFHQELHKNKSLFFNTIVALATAIDAKDHYIHGHTARVTEYSLLIARRILSKGDKRVDEKFLEELHIAGLLHDIGKIGIPESILNKEGSLSFDERKKMQEHPVVGVAILQPIRELENSILGVKYHHERYDGLGYPEGLRGEEIPLIAAIISVADAFDAMITDRPYRGALKRDEAVNQLKINSSNQFNPQVACVLIELCQEGRI